MNCNKAIELLPGCAIGALSDDERAQLAQHLDGGCQSCRQELDALTAAASLLAESVTPIAPPSQVKLALLERIDNEQRTPGDANAPGLPNRSLVTKHRWQSSLRSLPYIAATLCAVAIGSWVARYSDSPEKIRVDQSSVRDRASRDKWQQRIAAAEQAFGAPHIQLAKLESDAPGRGLAVVVFWDGLSGEYHVLVSNTAPPSQGRQLWLWFFDRQGARLSQGPLEYLGQGHAAGIVDLSAAHRSSEKHGAARVFRVIITDQPLGDHAEPTGPEIGRAHTSMR